MPKLSQLQRKCPIAQRSSWPSFGIIVVEHDEEAERKPWFVLKQSLMPWTHLKAAANSGKIRPIRMSTNLGWHYSLICHLHCLGKLTGLDFVFLLRMCFIFLFFRHSGRKSKKQRVRNHEPIRNSHNIDQNAERKLLDGNRLKAIVVNSTFCSQFSSSIHAGEETVDGGRTTVFAFNVAFD